MIRNKQSLPQNTVGKIFLFMGEFFFLFLHYIIKLIRFLLVLIILIPPLAYSLKYVENADSYLAAYYIRLANFYLCNFVFLYFPSEIKGTDYSGIIATTLAILIRIPMKEFSAKVLNFARSFYFKRRHQRPIPIPVIPFHRKELPTKKKKLPFKSHKNVSDEIKNMEKRDRGELLKILGEVKRDLESMKTELTFVSIDVVNSTGMKKGEDPTDVELDFIEYKHLVEKAFDDNGYLKAAWTPDGVMCCFGTGDNAINASRQVIRELGKFNKKKKIIKHDFQIRCGVNSGKVAYEEKMPLETISDHSIDIAGHFQKYGAPGLITISKSVYDSLSNPNEFKHSDQKIDSLDVYASNS